MARPPLALVVAVFCAARIATAQPACVGDCNHDGQVSVSELITGVNITLGAADLANCVRADANDDGAVSVAELVVAVNGLLQGCGGEPLPTPTNPPPSGTPTVTPTPASGPVISFIGLTSADNSLQPPSGMEHDVPVYVRPFGFGFSVVVEAHRGVAPCGAQACPVGKNTYQIGGVPDLQIQVTRDLGDGSAAVCDDGTGDPPVFGGVPGIDPPRFDDPDAIADALNDLGCRFVDGTGGRSARGCTQEACIRFENGEFGCEDGTSEWQFCAPIPMPLQFPPGDTLVSVRVRDAGGNLGAPAQLIVRVSP